MNPRLAIVVVLLALSAIACLSSVEDDSDGSPRPSTALYGASSTSRRDYARTQGGDEPSARSGRRWRPEHSARRGGAFSARAMRAGSHGSVRDSDDDDDSGGGWRSGRGDEAEDLLDLWAGRNAWAPLPTPRGQRLDRTLAETVLPELTERGNNIRSVVFASMLGGTCAPLHSASVIYRVARSLA